MEWQCVIHCHWPQLTQTYTDCQASSTTTLHYRFLIFSPSRLTYFVYNYHDQSSCLLLLLLAKHLQTHLPFFYFSHSVSAVCVFGLALWPCEPAHLFLLFLQTVCAFAASLSLGDLILCSVLSVVSLCFPVLHLFLSAALLNRVCFIARRLQ